ncbi:MAG: superoxide dismutase [Bacilli bacterium]|nr:superoxide dismutase [Bacilli bacterium]MDD4282559.1 superoxide dismutase [Bacilli bacterium]MDD4718954.1 superoxide dismutase [Bacilli bacterium]
MYDIPNLPYLYDALEPYIDQETVKIHYEKHHQGYLNNLNEILEKINFQKNYTLIELVENIDELPIEDRGEILFNAGGVLNHNLYWKNMSQHRNNRPVGKLADAINKEYGSFETFKNEFIKQASLLRGSGFTFLVINHEGNLEIINTPNQETPYLYKLIPIMALDLWEHSYYLLYQNRRSEYINNFFNIVDFVEINKLYEENI